MGSRAERIHGKEARGPGWARQRLVDWTVPHLHADKMDEQLGSKKDHSTRIPVWRNKASKPLMEKTFGS